ncbi:polysaccharide biosynthesis tyrosine autokinase [Bacillus timonensis]|nr:polysaccharide biosynthesis tyrosine autokinase [Bacillus timonensis]
MSKELELGDFLKVIQKGYKVIFAIVLFTTVLGAFVSYFVLTPVYKAQTDLLVATTELPDERLSSIEIETNVKLIETYKYILTSNGLLENVRDEIWDISSVGQLKEKIEIITSGNSQIITVVVEDSDPDRAVGIANTLVETFQAEIPKIMSIDNVHILSMAKDDMTRDPVWPNHSLNIIVSAFIGLTLSLLAISFKELINADIRTQQDIEQYIDLPTLGIIPQLKPTVHEKNLLVDDRYLRMISRSDPRSPAVEAFRSIRTNLQFKGANQELKTILFTSSISGEGKTVTSGNLAITMALDNRRTLLIDADLRKPNGHYLFNSPNRKGLTSYLTNNLPLKEVVKRTDIPNLAFLPSGPVPPNPAELLSSKKMNELLTEIKQHFDFIIIDSPPLVVTDAVILSTKVDGCIFVVNSEETKRNSAQKSIKKLSQVEANVVGVVLNDTLSEYYEQYFYD